MNDNKPFTPGVNLPEINLQGNLLTKPLTPNDSFTKADPFAGNTVRESLMSAGAKVIDAVAPAIPVAIKSFQTGDFRPLASFYQKKAGEYAKDPTKLAMGMLNPEEDMSLILNAIESSAAQEAGKYKSAEEFVNSQPSVWHATSKEAAQSIEKNGFKANVGERSLGVTKGKGVFFWDNQGSAFDFESNFIRKGIEPTRIEAKINGKIFDATNENRSIRAIAEDTKLIKKLKSEEYVGVRGTELDAPVTFVFEPSAIKTKSQLTDFYNQVTKGVKSDIKIAKEVVSYGEVALQEARFSVPKIIHDELISVLNEIKNDPELRGSTEWQTMFKKLKGSAKGIVSMTQDEMAQLRGELRNIIEKDSEDYPKNARSASQALKNLNQAESDAFK